MTEIINIKELAENLKLTTKEFIKILESNFGEIYEEKYFLDKIKVQKFYDILEKLVNI